jgi:DNA-binding NtrC family response regulator
VIAACQTDLAKLEAKGQFRSDLRYRLEVLRLEVPALRERPEDITELSQRLLLDVCQRFNLPHRHLSKAAIETLVSYRFPGNVRQLRHVLANAAISAETTTIQATDLTLEPVATSADGEPDGAPVVDAHLDRAVAIRRALQATGGHRGQAAELMGVARSTLYRYLEIYGIDASQFTRPAPSE